MSFDDPNNKEFLESVKKGYVIKYQDFLACSPSCLTPITPSRKRKESTYLVSVVPSSTVETDRSPRRLTLYTSFLPFCYQCSIYGWHEWPLGLYHLPPLYIITHNYDLISGCYFFLAVKYLESCIVCPGEGRSM